MDAYSQAYATMLSSTPSRQTTKSFPKAEQITFSPQASPQQASSPQEGGMDAYSQAYATMLSSTFSRQTKKSFPIAEQITFSPQASPPQASAGPVPSQPAPSQQIPSSRMQEGSMDAYAQAYATMVSAPSTPSTTPLEQFPDPKSEFTAIAASSSLHQLRNDDDDNASMSAYEKAYAAMMHSSTKN